MRKIHLLLIFILIIGVGLTIYSTLIRDPFHLLGLSKCGLNTRCAQLTTKQDHWVYFDDGKISITRSNNNILLTNNSNNPIGYMIYPTVMSNLVVGDPCVEESLGCTILRNGESKEFPLDGYYLEARGTITASWWPMISTTGKAKPTVEDISSVEINLANSPTNLIVTYSNPKLGISFDYPSKWIVGTSPYNDEDKQKTVMANFFLPVGDTYNAVLDLSVYENPDNLSFEDYDKKITFHTYSGETRPDLSLSKESFMLDNGKKVFFNERTCGSGSCKRYLIPTNSKIFEIYIPSSTDESVVKEILPTLKITQ
jgi:hypothetical protein